MKSIGIVPLLKRVKYNISARPHAGLFFCLASDTVQGFCFARMQYSPKQAFTACFVQLMQLYGPRHKTAHRALQRLFLRLHPFNLPKYQTNKSGYNAPCDTLEGIPAPGRAPPIPDTTATPERCTGQHSPPIIIRYIRGCRGAPCCGSMPDGAAHRRPCQRRRVSVSTCAGSARRLAVWHRSARHPPPGGAVQQQRRGGRRGPIDGYRRISFRAFAR